LLLHLDGEAAEPDCCCTSAAKPLTRTGSAP